MIDAPAGGAIAAPADTRQPPFPLALATEVARSFSRAVKAHQLYLPNNPMRAKADESLRLAFEMLWHHTDRIVLEIGETEFRCYGQKIFEEPERTTESIPWTFYKDGVRELEMRRGFERSDLQLLLDLLQRVRTAPPDDDDLLTLLWEEEFANLEYRYIDAGSGELAFDPIEAGEQPDKFELPAGMTDLTPERLRSSASAGGIVSMDDFDSTLYFLEEREIEYLRAEIARDFSTDLRPSIAAALLDTFELQADATAREEIAGILEHLLIVLLSSSAVKAAAYLLRELAVTLERTTGLQEPLRRKLQELPERLSEPAALTQLLETVDLMPLSPPQVDLPELFGLLRPAALETVFLFLTRTQNPSLRTLLEGAADRLASLYTAELVRLIRSPDPGVALEAIQRAAAMKAAVAVPALAQVATDGITAQMRLAAALALADIGSPGALQALERTLDDAERDIRVAAARALAVRGYRAALPRVERAIRGRTLKESNLQEKLAFYEAYGAMAGDAAVPYLSQVLNGRSALGRREDAELRACAAAGLGKIPGPKALQALERASTDRDVLVRNAVSRAMREGIR
ncbi:MAG TPA: HEAT repeat domain-containing protein [Gemmatimonadaceae bacterium]|nr:HEAT repeat domain-containing protein [Gemmatimonadaceae bacterium]